MSASNAQKKAELKSRKAAILKEQESSLQDIEEELKDIQQEELRLRDVAEFQRLVKILDNGDILISLMGHGRTSTIEPE